MAGRTDRDPDDQRDSDNHGKGEEAAYVMRALLLPGADRSLDVRGMGSAMVAALRGIVDSRAGYADGPAHAEILAIRQAAAALGAYRLEGAALFVTLEPCVMCVGAMVQARIAELYFGARDEKAGALGSVYDIGRDGRLNHRIEVYGGVMESECAVLLRDFFRSRRSSG